MEIHQFKNTSEKGMLPNIYVGCGMCKTVLAL